MDYYKCLAGLLGKSDGRDKFLAAIQFVAMFTAASQAKPGHAAAIAKNLGGARKPFRILKPLDVLVQAQTRIPGLRFPGVCESALYLFEVLFSPWNS